VTPEQLGEWVRLIVAPVVKEPRQLSVEHVGQAGRSTLLVLRTSPSDAGRVIGRGGSIIVPLRELVAAVGTAFGRQVVLELEEEARRR
jgi:predicted RNA-binding protein YlqC (UPF0109 family)